MRQHTKDTLIPFFLATHPPAGALRGRIFLPALPHFHSVPHPDDVSLSLLLAPGLYPLKAEAAVPAAALGSGDGGGSSSSAAATPGPGAQRQHRRGGAAVAPVSTPSSLSSQSVDAGDEAGLGRERGRAVRAGRRHRPWGVLRLFRRPGSGEGAPVELEVRVEGKGLHTITRAWVEASGGGLPGRGSAASGKAGEGGPAVAAAQIMWQPPPPAPGALHRRAAAPASPVTSFFSWWVVISFLQSICSLGHCPALLAAGLVLHQPLAVSGHKQRAGQPRLHCLLTHPH